MSFKSLREWKIWPWCCLALVLAALSAMAAQPARPIDAGRQNALALEQQGKIAEAEAAWRAMSQAHPRNPEPYAHLGLLEARQERYAEAIPLYRKALALDPRVSALRLNLGLALFKHGDLKAAIAEFAMLRKGLPDGSADANRVDLLTGMAHYGLAQYSEAVPTLKAASRREPQNQTLLLTLAHSCLWSRQFDCVMDTYKQILALNAESAEADMLAGEALDEMKDNEGATKMFRAAVKANPKEPNVHFGLGYLLWTQKQYSEAATEFAAELQNDAKHAQALLYLGDSYLQLNRPEEAQPRLEQAVRLDVSLWLGLLDLGVIDADAGRNEQALARMRKAAELKPDDVNVHWRLGRLLRTMGHKQEAAVELEKANKLNKAADDDLYKKISNGARRPPEAAAPAGEAAH